MGCGCPVKLSDFRNDEMAGEPNSILLCKCPLSANGDGVNVCHKQLVSSKTSIFWVVFYHRGEMAFFRSLTAQSCYYTRRPDRSPVGVSLSVALPPAAPSAHQCRDRGALAVWSLGRKRSHLREDPRIPLNPPLSSRPRGCHLEAGFPHNFWGHHSGRDQTAGPPAQSPWHLAGMCFCEKGKCINWAQPSHYFEKNDHYKMHASCTYLSRWYHIWENRVCVKDDEINGTEGWGILAASNFVVKHLVRKTDQKILH